MYELFLQWKQGDEFADHLKATKTVAAALRRWGTSFIERGKICEELAAVLDGKNIDVDAGTHTIMFSPIDKDAEKSLNALVKKKLISVTDDGENDEG